jgi:hypothetical protein
MQMSATPVHRRKTRVSLSAREKSYKLPGCCCRRRDNATAGDRREKKTTHERSVWLIVINDASLINLTHQQEIIFSAG